jgi:hypothetical protein
MIVPDKLIKPDTAFLLRVQNSMCVYERETLGCTGIECYECMLDTDLKTFGEWLSKQVTEAQDA